MRKDNRTSAFQVLLMYRNNSFMVTVRRSQPDDLSLFTTWRREAKTRIRQRDWLKWLAKKFAANKWEAFLHFFLFARTNWPSGKKALVPLCKCFRIH